MIVCFVLKNLPIDIFKVKFLCVNVNKDISIMDRWYALINIIQFNFKKWEFKIQISVHLVISDFLSIVLIMNADNGTFLHYQNSP